MADEAPKEGEQQEENKAPAEGAAPAAADAKAPAAAAKPNKSLLIILGGCAAGVIAMAYFMAIAAVHTSDAASIPLGYAKVEDVAAAKGEPVPVEKKEGEGHGEGEKKEEGGHGESGGHGEGGEPANAAPKASRYQKLDEIQINPSQTGLKRFVKAQFGVVLGGGDAEKAAVRIQNEDEVKARIKDAILFLIRNKKVDELEGDAALKIIKNEVRRIVETNMKNMSDPDQAKEDSKVIAVLVDQFLVQ